VKWEVDCEKAITVAITGIISVFLALGILNITVSLSGYFFRIWFEKNSRRPQAGS
jgi:succinate dehydrogenase hydrophobic anchor subunit